MGPPAFVLAAILALVAGATLTDTATTAQSASTTVAPAPMVGVFTGEYMDGAPVYRLPPVDVVATPHGAVARKPRD